MRPYQIRGVWYYPAEQPDYDERGTASWYGEQFHNRQTADGEIFDMELVSAAHKTLPLPSIVEVTNLDNGRTLTVRVNDRGPFVEGRIIDLSRAAADELGFLSKGLANVRVRYLGPAERVGARPVQIAAATPPKPPAEIGPRAVVPPPSPLLRPGAPQIMALPLQSASAVVAPPPASAPQPPLVQRVSAPPVIAGPFRVQAGAFSDLDNARRVADRLAQAGQTAIEPAETAQGRLYRVVVGPGVDANGAELLRARVAEAGFPSALVVRF